MVDHHFYPSTGPTVLDVLLEAAGPVELRAPLPESLPGIDGAADLDTAGPTDLALAVHRRYAEGLSSTRAGAVIVHPSLVDTVPGGSIAVAVTEPHLLFASLLDLLFPEARRASATAPHRDGDPEPLIELGALIADSAIIGSGTEIGRGTIIGPHAVIGAGVTLGRNCRVGPGVSIECAYLGDRVVLNAGVRIGTEGFGWLDQGRSNRKVPQLGRVIIQDGVEIGANTTVDRGALGDTVIGENTKIDNLVQIGHNCRIGRNCLIAAMAGLSGGTVIGDGVLIGGGVGTSGHLSVGDGSILHGRAAVTKDWPAGSKLAGAPAQDIKDFWHELAVLRRLAKGGDQ